MVEFTVGKRRQRACRSRPRSDLRKGRRSEKPEPAISRVLSRTIIHLGRPSPAASSNLPGSPLGTGGSTPLFGLAPGGVYRAAVCYQPRGALLPHLFTLTGLSPGGLFSVALSMGLRPPGVTWRPVRRSPDFPLPLARQRLPGRLRRFRTADSIAFRGPPRARDRHN